MKCSAAALAAFALLHIPYAASAALPVGAVAPGFTTQAALAGKPFVFALSETLKKGPVVLYFFPAAFTSGCTLEAHNFAEASAEFSKAGATVIGLAADPIDKLARFSVEECRSKFAVGTATAAIIKDFDVKMPLFSSRSNRTSYVIAPDGRITFVYSSLRAADHVANTLAAVKQLSAAKRHADTIEKKSL